MAVKTFWTQFYSDLKEEDFIRIVKLLGDTVVDGSKVRWTKENFEKVLNHPDGAYFLKLLDVKEDDFFKWTRVGRAFLINLSKFFKNNPAYLTDRILEACPPLLKENFIKWKENKLPQSDIPIVSENQMVVYDKKHAARVPVRNDEIVYHQTLSRLIDVMYKVSKSIKIDEIKNLSPEKKIKILKDIATILSFKPLKGFSGGNTIFKNLNIFTDQIDKLEKAMIEWVKNKE